MKIKNLILICITLILICLMSFEAFAYLGITPPKIIYNFRPNLEDEVVFHIYGEANPFEVELSVSGSLAEYITLNTPSKVTVESTGQDVNFSMLLPEDLEPGRYKSHITVEKTVGGAGMVGGKEAVGYTIQLDVPYPGKYVDVEIEANDVEINESAKFDLKLSNLGSEIIKEVQGVVQVFDPQKNLLAEVETGRAIDLIPGERDRVINAFWTANVSPGVYTAKALVEYDDEDRIAEDADNFLVGQLHIEILNVTPLEIDSGEVVEFTMDLMSVWNLHLEDVKIAISIYDSKGELVDVLQGYTIDLAPMIQAPFSFYWSADFKPGDYVMDIKLTYGKQTTQDQFDLKLIGEKRGISFVTGALIVVIIALILLILFIIFKRRKKKEDKKKEEGMYVE